MVDRLPRFDRLSRTPSWCSRKEVPVDNRPQHLIEADEFIKNTDESIKDDMLYWIAKNHRDIFDTAKFAAC